ncbi:MAG: class I SAM-dependent methyltransferase [Candidatus Methanoperedenaceae archaeon]|nr:MAG: class I SAM-dependent methyltransferase [Candidatus Methanoperedenaceae archaeon]
MSKHIKAWENEYGKSIWKGHYSLELLDVKKGRLLDAGCGSGKYSIPLRMRGFEVVGIDVSFNALNMLRNSSKARDIDIEILGGNVFQLPFKTGSYDLIWCYEVLQHILSEERECAAREFRRILRKDGILFMEVFGKDDLRYGGIEIEPGTFSRENGIVYHYFDRAEIEELLRDFSCKVIESRKVKMFRGKSYTRHMISAVAKKI